MQEVDALELRSEEQQLGRGEGRRKEGGDREKRMREGRRNRILGKADETEGRELMRRGKCRE